MKRGLLVGAGGMGRAWADNISRHDDAQLVGWVDIHLDTAVRAATDLGLDVPCFESLEVAIAQLSPDFVVDVTIPTAHEAVVTTALSAGIAVLGEKPMSLSIESAKRMIAASERAGKLYMVSQSRRYDGRLSAFRDLVKTLGPLGILNADFYIGAHFGGFREAMEHVLLIDMAIHTFDAARAVSGADPISVYAEEFNPEWSWYANHAAATCLFEMSNGLRFQYRGAWCSDGFPTSWESSWRAVGPSGTAIWDGNDSIEAETVASEQGFIRETHRLAAESHSMRLGIDGSLTEFLGACERGFNADGSRPQGECHDNLLSLAMVLAAVQSSQLGRRVSIADLLA